VCDVGQRSPQIAQKKKVVRKRGPPGWKLAAAPLFLRVVLCEVNAVGLWWRLLWRDALGCREKRGSEEGGESKGKEGWLRAVLFEVCPHAQISSKMYATLSSASALVSAKMAPICSAYSLASSVDTRRCDSRS
jgi:hypothetical protein